jgi:predicted dienelactone hydrolase
VGVRTVTFVDTSRPTAAAGSLAAKPSRTLVTNLWYPAGGPPSDTDLPDAPAARGPFPLIVFSHGQSGEPQQYEPVLRLWASAGYVVAAPRHPLTIRGLPGGPYTFDYQNQPGDVSFVITRMGATEPKLVDLKHVGAAGHSSGAITVRGAASNTCCHDDRIDAVVLESLLDIPFRGTYSQHLPAVPVLFLHGDADPSSPISGAHRAFERAKPPKFFVTIHGGGHSPPYRGGPPDYHLVARASIDFFDRYLKGRDRALDQLRRDVAAFPFGRLEAVM